MNLRALSVALGCLVALASGCSSDPCEGGACPAPPVCTPGASQCVGAFLMRTCVADGSSWVASSCAEAESCDPDLGACARATAVACGSADDDCVGGVPFVCKADGSGFETTACPAGTHCVGGGRCQGDGPDGCVLGTSCSGDTVVSCADGRTESYLQCAVGHSCVVDLATRGASCKRLVCSAGTRTCGNPAEPAADPGAFASSCRSDGSGWTVARCEAGSVCAAGACVFDCVPGESACSDNSIVSCDAQGQWDLASVENCGGGRWCSEIAGRSICSDVLCVSSSQAGVCVDFDRFRGCRAGILQPAVECPGGCSHGLCLPSCVDGETRCSGNALQTCAGGKWPGASGGVPCNDPLGEAVPASCIPLSEVVGARKAVCGDGACAGARLVCEADGRVRYCVDGKLLPAEACPAGSRCQDPALGCWADPCESGESTCSSLHGYVSCEGGEWSDTYETCGLSAVTGALQRCEEWVGAGGLRGFTCVEAGACTAGARRCSADGLGIETCQPDRSWGAAANCAIGTCSPSGAVCLAQCKPSAMLCGGSSVAVYGQAGWSKSGICTASGRLPDWTTIPACAAGTACRTDASGAALGCVACVGSRLQNGFVDTRCSADGKSVVFCGENDSWNGDADSASCGNQRCVSATAYLPADCE